MEDQCWVTGVSMAFNETEGIASSRKNARNASICSLEKLCTGLKSRKFKKISQRMQKFRCGDDPDFYFLTVQIAADHPEPVRIIEII